MTKPPRILIRFNARPFWDLSFSSIYKLFFYCNCPIASAILDKDFFVWLDISLGKNKHSITNDVPFGVVGHTLQSTRTVGIIGVFDETRIVIARVYECVVFNLENEPIVHKLLPIFYRSSVLGYRITFGNKILGEHSVSSTLDSAWLNV